MEKLIKLLNEYSEIRKYNNAGIVEWVEHTKGNLYWKYWENTWSYMVVISKEYGFIKWLVENDKIDNSKFYDKNILKGFMTLTKEEKADSIIMNLSISEIPISDLISYLK